MTGRVEGLPQPVPCGMEGRICLAVLTADRGRLPGGPAGTAPPGRGPQTQSWLYSATKAEVRDGMTVPRAAAARILNH